MKVIAQRKGKSAIAALLSGIALMTVSAGHAQSEQDGDALLEAGDGFLLHFLNQDSAKEQYLSVIARPLRHLDRDADGLDERDVARARAQDYARQRAGAANTLLRFDYDGDLKVTRAEIIEFSKLPKLEQRKQEADRQMQRYDTNGDGTATLQEAMELDQDRLAGTHERHKGMLEFDTDGDGQLTVPELLGAAKQVFDRFDTDRDGLIGTSEYAVVSDYKKELRQRQRLVEFGCVYPKASRNALLVAYGTYSSDVLSTAWVGGPDTETGVIDVTIEPGSRPLYLVLGSYDAMIWRFSGATERIERVVASALKVGDAPRDRSERWPPRSAVAVTGIDADRFEVLNGPCMGSGWEFGEGKRDSVDRIGQMIAGRAMDSVAGEYSPVRVALPSGTSQRAERANLPAPPGYEAAMWREALRFTRGGIRQIDPKALVTSQPVGAYKIMPEQFGLAQLLANGTLQRAGSGRLMLTRKIDHWPSGLAGAHSVIFIVKDGVTPPDDKPGHSCVISEKDAASENFAEVCAASIPPSVSVRG